MNALWKWHRGVRCNVINDLPFAVESPSDDSFVLINSSYVNETLLLQSEVFQ